MTDRELLELIYQDTQELKKRVTKIEMSLENEIQNDITNINLHLENVTDRNIKIIAESHLDLSRKLNEIIRVTSDIKAYHELQSILVNEHEDKIKKII